MATSFISLVAFEARNPSKAFVRVPNESGRWVYTDRCVVEVHCPTCGAVIGEPCNNGRGKYTAGTHYTRRNLWKWSRKHWAQDIAVEVLPPKPHIRLKVRSPL